MTIHELFSRPAAMITDAATFTYAELNAQRRDADLFGGWLGAPAGAGWGWGGGLGVGADLSRPALGWAVYLSAARSRGRVHLQSPGLQIPDETIPMRHRTRASTNWWNEPSL